MHTDVRLALGWAGVGVALFTGLYGWKVEFEKSKPVVGVGLVVYVVSTYPYHNNVDNSCVQIFFIDGDTDAVRILY